MALFSRSFVRRRVISLATTASVTATSFALAQDHSEERAFLTENAAAMNEMMADMTIKPTGDIDRDFVEMMVPHHQGAVEMAEAELKYGHNQRLRRLAQEIVANQQQEITTMQNAVSEHGSSTVQLPDQPGVELSPQSTSPDGAVTDGGMKMSQ